MVNEPYSDRAFFNFLGPGGGESAGVRRSYTCNSITPDGMATKFTQNDVLINSII